MTWRLWERPQVTAHAHSCILNSQPPQTQHRPPFVFGCMAFVFGFMAFVCGFMAFVFGCLALCLAASRRPCPGLAVAFVAPLAGVLLIAEQSAANLGEAVYWRALLATSAAVLALNVLVTAYSEGADFWDTRCVRMRHSCAVQTCSDAVISGCYLDGQCVTMKAAPHVEPTSGCFSIDMQPQTDQ